MSLLRVEDLSVVYDEGNGTAFEAVKKVGFALDQGEFVGLVGESGSGKSTLGFALTRLSKPPARIAGGRILFDGTDIAALSTEEVRTQRQGGINERYREGCSHPARQAPGTPSNRDRIVSYSKG